MSSTLSNDVINVKPCWGCCFWILNICFLVRKIYTWKVGTTPQYIFSVRKCTIRLRICAHYSRFHIRCFGRNMTPTYFVFQWNYTMSSTMSNDVINVKPYWGCCFWILIIFLLVRNIDTWKFGTALQYTFPVWKCTIRLRICAHYSRFHIRCFGRNMTPMWHHCIFICLIYVVWFFTRPSALRILALIIQLFSNTYHARIAIINV